MQQRTRLLRGLSRQPEADTAIRGSRESSNHRMPAWFLIEEDMMVGIRWVVKSRRRKEREGGFIKLFARQHGFLIRSDPLRQTSSLNNNSKISASGCCLALADKYERRKIPPYMP